MSYFYQKIMPYEERWCKAMGYFNPYIDIFTSHLTNQMPFFDSDCYERYPRFKHVYDKLWVVKSQGLPAGRLEKLKGKEDKVVYPIFIKPRWGHLSASSKNCYKVNSAAELKQYIDYKDMMWSEYIDAKEIMTDYVLLNGKIVHQMTMVYSDKQNGFSDVWKYISPESTPLANITEWVNEHMKEFTGIVNVQYRDNKIIEISLRLARGGAYLLSTENHALITNINNIFIKKEWNYNLSAEMKFKPFYAFKCFTKLPILFVFPQKMIDWYVKKYQVKPFYEYYFEPVGKSGMVFFQFMHDDFERGMQTKEAIEAIFDKAQYLMYALIVIAMFIGLTGSPYRYPVFFFVLFIFLLRLFNPFNVNFKLYKAQMQDIFKEGPTKEEVKEVEPFDAAPATAKPKNAIKSGNAMPTAFAMPNNFSTASLY